jgi:hypothetical protein
MTERRVEELLRDHRVPDEPAAEDRAWRVVRAGYARAPVRAPVRSGRRLALVAAAAAALLALALTGPGAAVADWVRDAITQNNASTRPLTSLPSSGRLLVESGQGPWIVSEDGSKRRLGEYEEATWSPRGLFVAATRPNELLALDTKGSVRWSLARRGAVRQPRWSPDGFHIAYLSGGSIRVVAGDGTGDARIGPARNVAPSWQPSSKLPVLAFVDRAGAIRVTQAAAGPPLWRFAGSPAPTQLDWAPDGSALLALSPERLRIFDSGGRLRATHVLPRGTRAEAAAYARSGASIGLISRNTAGTRGLLTVLRVGDGRITERRVLSAPGRFGRLAWSPDGDWLLASWPSADQWLFIRIPNGTGPPGKVVTVSGVAGQFDPGQSGIPASPVPDGWCCAP